MSILCKSEQRKNAQDTSAYPKFYLSSKAGGRINLHTLLNSVCDNSTIDPDEVRLTLRRIFKKTIEYPALGFTVRFDDPGYFSVQISREGSTTEKEATSEKVRNKRVVFYPGSELREAIKRARVEKVSSGK